MAMGSQVSRPLLGPDSVEDGRRGGFRLSTVILTALFAEVNIRKLEKWAAEGNRVIDHPILNNPYEQQDQQAA